MPIILALLAAALFGVADYFGGSAARRANAFTITLVGEVVALAVILAMLPAAGAAPTEAAAWVRLLGAGAASGLGLALLYSGLARGAAAIVAPTAAGVGAVVPVIVGLLGGDRLSTSAYVGLAVGCVAVGLVSKAVSLSPACRIDLPTMALTIASGVCFGLNFTLLDHGPQTSAVWPLAIARLGSTVALAPIVAHRVLAGRRQRAGHLTRPSERSNVPEARHADARQAARRTWRGIGWFVVGAGLFDLAANAAYLQALRVGMLSVVAMVTSLYPAVTVGLSLWRRGERVRGLQQLGLALAAMAVVLVSAGNAV